MSKGPQEKPTTDETQSLTNTKQGSSDEPNIRVDDVEDTPALDPRFHQPTPSPFKRAALLILIGLLFWLAFNMRRQMYKPKPQIIYASRYSKEHRFRPAASPVITEILKDGRTRLRGADPSTTPVPTPTSVVKKKRKTKGGKKRSNSRKPLKRV